MYVSPVVVAILQPADSLTSHSRIEWRPPQVPADHWHHRPRAHLPQALSPRLGHTWKPRASTEPERTEKEHVAGDIACPEWPKGIPIQPGEAARWAWQLSDTYNVHAHDRSFCCLPPALGRFRTLPIEFALSQLPPPSRQLRQWSSESQQ